MEVEIFLLYICWILISNVNECYGLKCFECDNKINPACGVYFKSYQFMPPSECWGYVKCGLQRQQPLKDDTQQPYTDNFIGILRRCYYLGTLPGIDETDGCKTYVLPPNNDTFQFCFCSKDYCNVSCTVTSASMLTLCGVAFALYHILLVRKHI